MTFYEGEAYLELDAIEALCREMAEAAPGWVSLEEVGQSRQGRPLWLLSFGRDDGDRERRSALWIDAGTHASEWCGVSAAVYVASRWAEALAAGDEPLQRWFSSHTAYLMPCLSPDGYEAMRRGEPYLRSTLRPPKAGQARQGLEPRDIDGDGAVRWMRWRHPAGPFVPDEELELFMRPRRLDDDPQDAFFLCDEGDFLNWDGVRWTSAPLRYGLDLNRNFPSHWEPFSMFGMDAGAFPTSEPESRAVIEAFAARPTIAAALTHHTYTGCILTQPYRQDSPLGTDDIRLMEELARDMAEGTDYAVYRVCPDFMYDASKPVVGVWSDTLATVFGVPGYTVEFWDPFGHADVKIESPAAFFTRPDADKIRALIAAFSEEEGAVEPWRPFDHPQLGPVEIGGLDYLHTIRNPPVRLLGRECERGFQMAERLRRALPEVQPSVQGQALGDGCWRVEIVLENMGFLPTSALRRGEQIGATTGASVTLVPGDGLEVEGPHQHALHHLDGWGTARVGESRHPLYASLPGRGHRAHASWIVRGTGCATIRWSAGRAGSGEVEVELEVELDNDGARALSAPPPG